MNTSIQRRIAALEAQAPVGTDLPSEIWLTAPGDEDHAVLLWRRDDE